VLLLLLLADLLTPQASFDAISQRLLVGPVVRTLVYDKIPNTVCDWVDSMCADWRFERIIPAHFSAPVRAGAARQEPYKPLGSVSRPLV
jgi:hypothetical protein